MIYESCSANLMSHMVAKKSVDIPVISEVTMSSGVELRRHSAGIASSGNNEKKVVPHYLRASTGSCHDFCKYGRKLVQEEKEKVSMTKRAGKLKASVDFELTKVSSMKHIKQVDSEFHISDTSETHKQELATKSCGSQKQVGNEIQVNKKKALLHAKSHISSIPKKRRQGTSSSLEMEIPSKPTSKRGETSPISTSPSRSSCERMKRALSKASSIEDSEMELSEKHVTSFNPDSLTKQTVSSMMKKRENSCKVVSLSRTSLSSKPSCKRISSTNARKCKDLKAEPEEHNNEPQEKTLYVIKMETANQTLQSDQNESQDSELSLSNSLPPPELSSSSICPSSSQEDQEKSDYATSEFEEDSSSGNSDIEYMENVETLEIEENEKPQMEKSSSKRLTFRRGKVLEDNAIDAMADANNVGAITGTEKVVLRHQDVQVKKDEQCLYNNVIKETASKLVETQKSKVKALVGAFETVISLQEKRTSANIVN